MIIKFSSFDVPNLQQYSLLLATEPKFVELRLLVLILKFLSFYCLLNLDGWPLLLASQHNYFT